MKNFSLKSTILSLFVLSALIFIPNFANAANHKINNQESLVSTIESAQSGDVIELTDNILLIKPLSITRKDITIDGKGHFISKVTENWSPNGADGSLISVGSQGTNVTLKNITLKNSQKYGVQSYNGAYVVLDNVTLSNNKYVTNAKNASLYNTGKTAKYGEQLLTLSTCSYHTKNGRFVLVAKKGLFRVKL